MNENVTYQDKWSENTKENKKYFNGTYILLNGCIVVSWTVTSDCIWKEITICELIRVNLTILSVVYPYAYKFDP